MDPTSPYCLHNGWWPEHSAVLRFNALTDRRQKRELR
jgi:hypothetical protein